MKKKIYVWLLFITALGTVVFAHPGRTDAKGCHTCKTNCGKYGLANGEYHCHDSNTSTSQKTTTKKTTTSNTTSSTTKKKTTTSTSKSNTSTKNTTTSTKTKIEEVKKSSDTSLKSLYVDSQEMTITDNMSYTTTKDKINIIVVAKDEKATVDCPKGVDLQIGENIIEIKVKAEDGTTKTYKLTITREEIQQEIAVISENVEDVTGVEGKQDDSTIRDFVVTAGVCGLGYIGYKKVKNKKQDKENI